MKVSAFMKYASKCVHDFVNMRNHFEIDQWACYCFYLWQLLFNCSCPISIDVSMVEANINSIWTSQLCPEQMKNAYHFGHLKNGISFNTRGLEFRLIHICNLMRNWFEQNFQQYAENIRKWNGVQSSK